MPYWLARLDAPMRVACLALIALGFRNAIRSGGASSEHVWFALWLVCMLGTALTAHIAGARNLLQFMGVLCLAAGALFDDVFRSTRRWLPVAAAGVIIIVAAAGNLLWLTRFSSYIPYPATDGHQAFLKQNSGLLSQNVRAIVYGLPEIILYARDSGKTISWNASQFAWTTKPEPPIPAGTKYVLMTSLAWDAMPPNHPARRVARTWKVAWSYKVPHVWELRLFENQQSDEPSSARATSR